MELIKFSESSVVKGLLLSSYDKFGPQPKYMFPKEVTDQEAQKFKIQNKIKLTFRDYMQISIKNLSLFISNIDYSAYKKNFQDLSHFGIVPFPDVKLTSLTFFHYIKIRKSEKPTAATFSVLVDENKRSFLYNNIDRFKPLILNFFNKLDKEFSSGDKTREEITPIFHELYLKIIEIENKPYSTIISKKKLKILMCGLDDAGKSSFLLSVDRKFSRLIGLKPTLGAEVTEKSIEALGSSIFIWDLGGQSSLREKYINKAHIYLYDADLIFYFIDIKNRERFEESFEYLKNIRINLKQFKQKPPFIFILSKGDKDILDTQEIIENIKTVKSKLVEITYNDNPEIHTTSIFSIFSILRAFSSGISKLSPNRELINLNLKNFSNRVEVYLSLLLNSEGLVLADYYSPKALSLLNLQFSQILEDEENLRNIFEITAPQFAVIYKIFSKFKTLQKDETIFKISDSVIFFKKIQIADYIMFILFLMDDETKKNKINELLPDFLYRTSDLLLRYIS